MGVFIYFYNNCISSAIHSMTTVSIGMAGVQPGDDGTNEMVALFVELRRK